MSKDTKSTKVKNLFKETLTYLLTPKLFNLIETHDSFYCCIFQVTFGLKLGCLATGSDQRMNVNMQLQDWDILTLQHTRLTLVLIHLIAQVIVARSNGTLEQAPLIAAILMTIVSAKLEAKAHEVISSKYKDFHSQTCQRSPRERAHALGL